MDLSDSTDHAFFKALADPTRLRIVHLLLRGDFCVGDITRILALPQSTVSRQLAILKAGGVVADARNGKHVHYGLQDGAPLDNLRPWLAELSLREPYQSDLITLSMVRRSGR
ncbi:metalloregulator ArsR/SmtB family transcription factor [candidate division GN15 bacterium]|nr:metalloregulator ArsR/SmtB family transcription factor [candidate division GN15 bacterium]